MIAITLGAPQTRQLVNGTAALLKNEANGRWHPIFFEDAPLPGPEGERKPHRQRSVTHHTSGFDSRDAAIANAKVGADYFGIRRLQFKDDIPWNGKGMPLKQGFLVKDILVFI